MKANLRWRAAIIERCQKDREFFADILRRCEASPIFAINLWYYTYKVKHVFPDGREYEEPASGLRNHPFITHPFQDYVLLEMERWRVEGIHGAILKSRAVGASWINAALAAHGIQFSRERQVMFMSSTEDRVDKSNDPDSLFWKIRYMLGIGAIAKSNNFMPPPLHEHIRDAFCNINSDETGSSVTGEATAQRSAHGQRRSRIVVDEAQLIRECRDIYGGAQPGASSVVLQGTALAGSYFNEYCAQLRTEVPDRTGFIEWPWYTDPRLMEGLRVDDDPDNPDGFTSNWLERQKDGKDPRWLAENIYRDLAGSGTMFVSPATIRQHTARYAVGVKPRRGMIVWSDDSSPGNLYDGDETLRKRDVRKMRWQDREDGPFSIVDTLPVDGFMGFPRPPQDCLNVAGADIGLGVGSSYTVFYLADALRRKFTMEFRSNIYSPEDAARMMVAMAIFCGGVQDYPPLCWEANGPGIPFGEMIVKRLRWPAYYRDQMEQRDGEKSTKRYGWHSSDSKKFQVLSRLRDAVAIGDKGRGIVIPFADCLRELSEFVVADNQMAPVHAKKQFQGTAERAQHGDRAIAAALAVRMVDRAPQIDRERALRDKASRTPGTVANLVRDMKNRLDNPPDTYDDWLGG